MNNISHTIRPYRPLITSMGLLLVSLLGLFVGVVPLIGKTIDAAQQLSPLREEVAVLVEKDQALAGFEEEGLQSKLSILLTAVPSEKDIPSLFSTVEAVSARSGVGLADMAVVGAGSVATSAAIAQTSQERQLGSGLLPFTIALDGTFEQISSFMSLVGSVRRLSRVRTFSFTVRDDGMVRVMLDMDAFWLPFPAVIGKVSQRISSLTAQQEDVITKVAALELVSSSLQVAPVDESLPAAPVKSDPFAP